MIMMCTCGEPELGILLVEANPYLNDIVGVNPFSEAYARRQACPCYPCIVENKIVYLEYRVVIVAVSVVRTRFVCVYI